MAIMSRLIFPLAATVFLLVAPDAAGPAQAGAPAVVRGAAVQPLADGAVRITVTLDRPAPARHFLLTGPDRLVVDVAGARVGFAAPPPCGGLVRAVRHGARPGGTARLVFDLNGAAAVTAQPAARASNRLVFVLSAPDAAGKALGDAPPPPLEARPPAGEDLALPVRPGAGARAVARSAALRTVVIDAGHGGHDPGALGAHGGREKAIVLAAALRLREELEARGGYRVVLTREGDVFLPLEERLRIARDQRADLFISLHADANENRNARGASVYTLSERGGARARGLMEAQDWDIDLGDEARSPAVHRILLDLAQRETTNRSADFAQALIGQLGGVSPLLRNTHRSAGFFVLLAPDVPAVLVELGFMTNGQDEARLKDPAERRRVMAAVADAIDVYFARPRAYAAR
ncbi:MAG: N-acetylmuramoyl-L-alanine amidase [Hyphomonadaceae bacterium]|nr:N-acetylmuramoyl-L-alanine amidase [Hyphomonadaceae bacterium]